MNKRWFWVTRHNAANSTKLALKRYANASVSTTISGPCSQLDVVQQIASSAAIAVESLAEELSTVVLPRGRACFGPLYRYLDEIAGSHAKMQWWITDRGLNLGVVDPTSCLGEFDQVAGRLTAERWQGGLTEQAVLEIAARLDERGFKLEELQPAQRKLIATYNQQHTHSPIKSFFEMARRPQFVRVFRRRLYVARNRYVESQNSLLA